MKEVAAKTKRIRVLMQNRSTAFSHRGGDTVLMERLKAGLEGWGVEVTIDTEMRENPSDYNLVHLFNFALPELLQMQGRRAVQSGRPFVVSTLCEDIPSFHNQSIQWAKLLFEYVQRGQDRAWFQEASKRIEWTPSARFPNDWVASNAAALYTNGKSESETILRDYGHAARIREVKLGHEIQAEGNPEIFVREYGVKDFIFCVGRLETRKNQLMLLKALEDVDIPLVLAGGGFSYQPDYDLAVRSFKRKGKTIILDKISSEMMASAYMACRIHVLASWYELPGLVSLEAAHYGKNIVATLKGTSEDYLENWAFYCDPADWRSVQNAVLAAYYSPAKAGISKWVEQYTWEEAAKQTYWSYCDVLGMVREVSRSAEERETAPLPPLGQYDMNSGATEFQELLERGEVAAKNRDFVLAKELLGKAERLNTNSLKVLRSLGAVNLADSDPVLARTYFQRALNVDSKDAKSLSGLGMCEMMLNHHQEAYGAFVASLDIQPNELVPILQLLECSYILGRFDDLERTLRRYILENPSDFEMKFCLAGCLYKLGFWAEAGTYNNEVLGVNPEHRGAKDLRRLLQEQMAAEPVKVSQPVQQNETPAIDTQAVLAKLIERKIEERTASAMPAAATQETAVPAGQPDFAAFAGVDAQFLEVEEKKRSKKYDDALEDLEAIMKRPMLSAQQWEKGMLLRADLKVAAGHLEEAKECFENVLKENPRCPKALAGKGALAAAGGDWANGKALFEEALAIDCNFDIALAGMGLSAQFEGNLDGAWEYYRMALVKNPENNRALLGVIELGYALNRLKEVEEAISNYLEMHPGDLDFIYALAGCYFAQNRIDDARSEVEKITLFQPRHERALELKGMIEAKMASGVHWVSSEDAARK